VVWRRPLPPAPTSLLVAFCAALLTIALATVSGLVAGLSRGVADGVISRSLEALWAFPAILLAGALGTALAVDGVRIGPFELGPRSLVLPVFVIGLVSVPYFARPLRAEVRTLRDRDFVVAARAIGAGPGRILAREILPNVGGLVLAVAPVILANALLLEAALSFIGVGVQAPDASWGTLIAEGVDRIETAPQLAIAPGVALLATVLGANLVARGIGGRLDRRLSPRVAW
jgi:peptide/nickel transport system permease protein